MNTTSSRLSFNSNCSYFGFKDFMKQGLNECTDTLAGLLIPHTSTRVHICHADFCLGGPGYA